MIEFKYIEYKAPKGVNAKKFTETPPQPEELKIINDYLRTLDIAHLPSGISIDQTTERQPVVRGLFVTHSPRGNLMLIDSNDNVLQ